MNQSNTHFEESPFSNIKVGSHVIFKDGSYACSIKNKSKELKHNLLGLNRDIWTVIAINTPCPTDPADVKYPGDCLRYANNCVLANEEGDIAFCSEINIKLVKVIVPELKEEIIVLIFV